jgi:hypothetical protein
MAQYNEHPTGVDISGLSTEQPSRNPYGIAADRGYGPDGLPRESEMSWATGLTLEGLEGASPREGGRYHGTAPQGRPRYGVSRDPRG